MIAIIDYGVGNLRSVEKAFHFIGEEAVVTTDAGVVLGADGVVLPGVGAYRDAILNLEKAGMCDVVKSVIARNKPFLGICLGMQLLFDYSEEGGDRVAGLGIFKGAIKQLPCNMGLKVPHMGWNRLENTVKNEFFKGLSSNPFVYFVHSFYLEAEDREIVTARTSYGIEFDVAIGKGDVFATQFHPEKSGAEGLVMLRNFAGLTKKRLEAEGY